MASMGPAIRISPPAWGWPAQITTMNEVTRDFPTRVGMARILAISSGVCIRFPHPRGDGPMRAAELARIR